MLHHKCVVNTVVISFNRCVVYVKHAHKPHGQDTSREKAIYRCPSSKESPKHSVE